MNGVLIIRGKFEHRVTQGEHCLIVEAEIGVKNLQTKECQGWVAITRGQEEARKDSTQDLRRSVALLTP